jgi:hypothetical protein
MVLIARESCTGFGLRRGPWGAGRRWRVPPACNTADFGGGGGDGDGRGDRRRDAIVEDARDDVVGLDVLRLDHSCERTGGRELHLACDGCRPGGRSGGRVWLIVIPLIVGFTAAQELVALVAAPENRDFATLLESDAGKAFLDGAFGWYGLILVMFLFNTVLGEELLFRGYLLPRMNGAFGRRDWVANGLLFAGYHLHVPWAIPGTLLEMFATAYPTKRYRSAWIGIAVHSAQSVFLGILILTLVV